MMNRKNCFYSTTGELSCVEKFVETSDIRIQETYYDGIPQNKRKYFTKLYYAFCVNSNDNIFVPNSCYIINQVNIKVIGIDIGAHYGKDIIHFDIMQNERETESYVRMNIKANTRNEFNIIDYCGDIDFITYARQLFWPTTTPMPTTTTPMPTTTTPMPTTTTPMPRTTTSKTFNIEIHDNSTTDFAIYNYDPNFNEIFDLLQKGYSFSVNDTSYVTFTGNSKYDNQKFKMMHTPRSGPAFRWGKGTITFKGIPLKRTNRQVSFYNIQVGGNINKWYDYNYLFSKYGIHTPFFIEYANRMFKIQFNNAENSQIRNTSIWISNDGGTTWSDSLNSNILPVSTMYGQPTTVVELEASTAL